VCNTPGMTFPNRDEPSCSEAKWGFRGVRFLAEVQIDETRKSRDPASRGPGRNRATSRAWLSPTYAAGWRDKADELDHVVRPINYAKNRDAPRPMSRSNHHAASRKNFCGRVRAA